MSSFKGYREPSASEKPNIFESGIQIDRTNFIDLFSAAVCWSAVTQKRVGNLVTRRREWFISFETGLLHFGPERYPFQALGTESAPSETWLWSWANESIWNEDTLKLADYLYALGEEWNLRAFFEPQFEITQVFNGFSLSAVAAMLSEKPVCFYRCPHETGAVFVAFGLVPKSVFEPVSAEVFVSTVMPIAQQAVCDHRIMVESFLFHNKTPYRFMDGVLVADFANQTPLAVSFDEYHRITAIRSGTNGGDTQEE